MTDADETLDETLAGPVEARPVPDDAALAALRAWVPHQRWFPAKGTDARVDRLAVADLPSPDDAACVQVHLLALDSGTVLQVPTVLRAEVEPGAPGVIARLEAGTLVDGPHDPAFVRAWLAAARHDGPPPGDPGPHHALGGEQSNTSVLVPDADPPAILKVFRSLIVGPNPDVAVPIALSRAGWSGVPRPLAWLAGRWPGVGGTAVGHLGVLSELVRGARDGFELACDLAGEGRSFGDLAEDLGRTTAQMHRALREALPAATDDDADPAQVVRTLRERAREATDRVPELAERADAIARAFDPLERLARVPPLQRVHGDFHLGQVLRSGDGRWYVLDFEGEPQASAAEKTRPDLALRDLAGMLRSLDYAAAVGRAGDPGWLAEARARLIAGYQAGNEHTDDDVNLDVLLPALELDKALYEVVYESGNRPDWVHIPLGGVDRLLRRD
jgi:maltokinase